MKAAPKDAVIGVHSDKRSAAARATSRNGPAAAETMSDENTGIKGATDAARSVVSLDTGPELGVRPTIGGSEAAAKPDPWPSGLSDKNAFPAQRAPPEGNL